MAKEVKSSCHLFTLEFRLFVGDLNPSEVKVRVSAKGSPQSHEGKGKLEPLLDKPQFWTKRFKVSTKCELQELEYSYKIRKKKTQLRSLSQGIETYRDIFNIREPKMPSAEIINARMIYLEELISLVSEQHMERILAELEQVDIFGKDLQLDVENSNELEKYLRSKFGFFKNTSVMNNTSIKEILLLGIVWTKLTNKLSIDDKLPVDVDWSIPHLRNLIVMTLSSDISPACKKSLNSLRDCLPGESPSLRSLATVPHISDSKQKAEGSDTSGQAAARGQDRHTCQVPDQDSDNVFPEVTDETCSSSRIGTEQKQPLTDEQNTSHVVQKKSVKFHLATNTSRCVIKRIGITLIRKNASKQRRGSRKSKRGESYDMKFDAYPMKLGDTEHWTLANTEVLLDENDKYGILWELEVKEGTQQEDYESRAPFIDTQDEGVIPNINSVVFCRKASDRKIISIQGSLVLLDMHLLNETESTNQDVLTRLEVIKDTRKATDIAKNVIRWACWRLARQYSDGEELSQKQLTFIFFVIKELIPSPIEKSSPTKEQAKLLLEALKSQHTLREKLSSEILVWLINIIGGTWLDALFYISLHVSYTKLQDEINPKLKLKLEIDETNWKSHCEEKINHIFRQHNNNKEGHANMVKFLEYFVLQVSSVGGIFELIIWCTCQSQVKLLDSQQGKVNLRHRVDSKVRELTQQRLLDKTSPKVANLLVHTIQMCIEYFGSNDGPLLNTLKDIALDIRSQILDRDSLHIFLALPSIHQNVSREDVKNIFGRLCPNMKEDNSEKLHHGDILKFLQSESIISKLNDTERRDMLLKLPKLITNITFKENQTDTFFHLYRFAVIPCSLNFLHFSEEIINECCKKLLAYTCPVSLLIKCFETKTSHFSESDLLWVTQHIIRLVLRNHQEEKVQVQIQEFMTVLSEIIRYKDNMQREGDTELPYQNWLRMIGKQIADLLTKLEFRYDSEKLTSDAEEYFQTSLSLKQGWEFIFTDSVPEERYSSRERMYSSRDRMLMMLLHTYRRFSDRLCSFTLVEFFKRRKDDFSNLISWLSGSAIKGSETETLTFTKWFEATEAAIKSVEKCRSKVTHIQRLLILIERLNKQSVVKIETEELHDVIGNIEKCITKGSDCLVRAADADTYQFWGPFNIALEISTKICEFSTSTVFSNVCLCQFKKYLSPSPSFEFFIQEVEQNCIPLFKELCQSLANNALNMEVYKVNTFLNGINDSNTLEHELHMIESAFLPIKVIPVESKAALNNFIRRKMFQKLCDIFELFEVCDSDWSFVPAGTVDVLRHPSQMENLTLQELHKAMDKMFDNDDWQILSALFDGKEVIEFLKPIIENDEDLRNLADVIEEHDERSFHVGIVADIIDVKRFIQAILKLKGDDQEKRKYMDSSLCQKFYTNEAITENDKVTQFATLTRKASKSTLAAQINACTCNIFNLKELYTQLADRGEMTRGIIQNTVDNGIFTFSLQNDNLSYIVRMVYKTKSIQRSYTLHELLVLKSRALLAVNSERSISLNEILPSNEFQLYERFISTIDDVTNITDLLNDLFEEGHFHYVFCQPGHEHSDKKLISRKSGDLGNLLKVLQYEYKTWVNILKAARSECYYLNFFDGNKFWMLEQLFIQTANAQEKSLVETILKQLDVYCPQPTVNYVKPEIILEASDDKDWTEDSHTRSKYETASRKRLTELGCSLETNVMIGVGEAFPEIFSTDKIAHCVQPGIVSLVDIDERKSHPISVLLQLYQNTIGAYPRIWQVLFCQQDTTPEDVELLLQRCRGASAADQPNGLFTLVNAEVVSREVRVYIINEIQKLCKTEQNVMLAIIISGRQSQHFVDRFPSDCTHAVSGLSSCDMAKYLQRKCKHFEIVTSKTPGLGKTEYVKAQALKHNLEVTSITLYGPISRESLVKEFSRLSITKETMLHIDVELVSNPYILDTFILELMVFGIVKSRVHVFSLDTEYVCVEIANENPNRITGAISPPFKLQAGDAISTSTMHPNQISCATIFKQHKLEWEDFDNYIVSTEINSSVQVVCHYLKAMKSKTLDKEDIVFTGEHRKDPLDKHECTYLLRDQFSSIPKHRMAFTKVEIYLNVFAGELRSMSASKFFSTITLNKTLAEDYRAGLRSDFVTALNNMAKTFTPLATKECEQKSDEVDEEMAVRTETTKIIKWEESNHTLLMFNSQDIETVTPFYRSVKHVEPGIKNLFETQLSKTLPDYEEVDLHDVLEKVCRTNKHKLEINFDYALTPDNMLKMILIYKRIMAGIPVIIMGETGCGKTLLLTYLARICEVPFHTMDIHAGTKRKDITEFMQKPVDEARNFKSNKEEARSSMVWIFFDEINTCNHLGLLSEIMLKNSCQGMILPSNLVFIAACNPYYVRKGSLQTSGGLSKKYRHDKKSTLVYRVEPLPKKMLQYVWDFGSLQEKDEHRYIREMTNKVQFTLPKLQEIFSKAVFELQKYTRKVEGTPYCVSLRDVHRCIKLKAFFTSEWFVHKDLAKIDKFLPDNEPSAKINEELELRSVILSLAHCYYSRLAQHEKTDVRSEFPNVVAAQQEKTDDRLGFSKVVADCFPSEYITPAYVSAVVKGEQADLLDEMDLPAGIAKTSVLRENVFVILVCILAHIPIFVVGNPGSGKSLSMQLIRSNLRGQDSKSKFFQKLPSVFVLSYQGSDSSTSEGIKEIFRKAETCIKEMAQTETAEYNVLPVVLLDEVGLAENSPGNPLKVLHSLLETKQNSKNLVSVVGISNWALDPAKMNRAVYLSRPEPFADDLYETAKTIRNAVDKDSKYAISDESLRILNDAYVSYTTTQTHKHFHGLRDYYAFVKYISAASKENDTHVDEESYIEGSSRLVKGLQRNFGGERDIGSEQSMKQYCAKRKILQEEGGQSSILEMISENIYDETARHLMIITDITSGDLLRSILEHQLKDREYQIIFGSHFQNDFSEDYFYRILSNIILYMEKGITIVLKDLTSIYGSLYDMLNQNYTVVGGKRSCRIALGPYRSPLCEVHNKFRCIVLIDEHEVKDSDPPFLNRFEKQFLALSDALSPKQNNAVEQIQKWANDFGLVEEKGRHPIFDKTDVFLGIHSDTIPSAVFNMTTDGYNCNEIMERCKDELISLACPEGILRASKSKHVAVSPKEVTNIEEKFFQLPHHNGLVNYLKTLNSVDTSGPSMTVIYTHTSIHDDIEGLINGAIPACVERLSNFKNEREFTEVVRIFFENVEKKESFLILQCSPLIDGLRMSLARYVIHDFKRKFLKTCNSEKKSKNVCIIVHIDRREIECQDPWQYGSLRGWNQITIESLLSSPLDTKTIIGKTLSKVIAENLTDFGTIAKKELKWAILCLKYMHTNSVKNSLELEARIAESDIILNLIKLKLIGAVDDVAGIQESEKCNDWLVDVACDKDLLYTHGTFDAAMNETIRLHIQRLLAKVVFFMEKNSAWIDVESLDADTLTLWKYCFQSSNTFDLRSSSIPEPKGPGSCVTYTKPLPLQFPFFMVFHEKIEKQRQLKQNQELIRNFASKHDAKLSMDVLTTLESVVSDAVPETEFYNYLDNHVETFLRDLYTVFSSDHHDVSTKGNLSLIHWFLENTFEPTLVKVEKAITKVALVYFQLWSAKDVFLAKLQLIMLYSQFSKQGINAIQCQGKALTNIVEEICKLTLPTREVIQSVHGARLWQRMATSIILCAGKISEDTSCSFHFLRLCRDFCALLQHLGSKDLHLTDLAALGEKLEDTIATQEVFDFLYGKIEHFRSHYCKDLSVEMIEDFAGSFFIRAFDANPDECFLKTAFEKLFDGKDGKPKAGASQLLLRVIKTDVEDGKEPDDSLLSIGDELIGSEDISDRFPNLQNIDAFLRRHSLNSHMAVMCCDLIEKTVFSEVEQLQATSDGDKHSVFKIASKSVSVINKTTTCSLQLLFSAGFISAFFNHALSELPDEQFLSRLEHLFDELIEGTELERERSFTLKVYLLKHLRRRHSMADLKYVCDRLGLLQYCKFTESQRDYSPMSYVNGYKDVKKACQKFEDNPEEQSFAELLSKANSQEQTALALSAVMIEKFGLSRRVKQLKSTKTDTSMAAIASKVRGNVLRNKEFSQFIQHLVDGTVANKEYNAGSPKTFQHISVMFHIASIILAKWQKGSFHKCLHPKQDMFLPASGVPVRELNQLFLKIPANGRTCCPSCSTVVIRSSDVTKQQSCPVCQSLWENLSDNSKKVQHEDKCDTYKAGYCRRHTDDMKRPDLSIRCFNPISYRVVSIFMHSIFLMGLFIKSTIRENNKDSGDKDRQMKDMDELKQLKDLFGLNDDDSTSTDLRMMVEEFLFQQIDNDWDVLQELLQYNSEKTTIFMHSVIQKTADVLTSQDPLNYSVENTLSKIIAKEFAPDTCRKFKENSHRHMGIDDFALEQEVDELFDVTSEKRLNKLPRLFRNKRTCNSFKPFKMCVINNLGVLSERHMFLCLVISMKDKLEHLRHIKPMLDWYLLVFNRLNHRIKRQETRKAIKEFIGDDKVDSLSHEHFASFRDSWNAVEQGWKVLTGKEPAIGTMSDKRDIAVCLNTSEEGVCNLKTIINILLDIQNQFLLKTHYIATSGKCPALSNLLDTHDGVAALLTISLVEAKREIISFTWHDTYLSNSYADTEYGKGETIRYNYTAMERQFCVALVLNKALLTAKQTFCKFVFRDELFNDFPNVIQEISSATLQKKLEIQHQDAISKQYSKEYDKSKKVMEQLGILLFFLQLSGGESTQPLQKYIADLRFSSTSNEFSSEVFTSLNLCHVVHLYEIFEGIMATPRFLTLPDDYCESLDDARAKTLDTNLQKLDVGDLEALFSAVKRFMYRYLRSSVPIDDLDSPLVDVVQKKVTITAEYSVVVERLPKEVQLRHTSNAVGSIQKHLNKRNDENKPIQRQPTPSRPTGRRNAKRRATYDECL